MKAEAAGPARLPVGLTLAVVMAMTVMIALGLWQLQRLQWKEALIAKVAALQAAPAQPLGPVLDALAAGRDAGFTRVRASCPGLAAAPFLELYALKDGQAGSRLISACRIESARYRTVLVDRGFVADTVSARPPVDPAAGAPSEITGVLRNPEPAGLMAPANRPEANRWFTRDVAAMAQALSAPQPAPVFLMAETSSNPEWRALVPAALPPRIANRHMEYALTWFGLAAALAGVYAALLLRKRNT